MTRRLLLLVAFGMAAAAGLAASYHSTRSAPAAGVLGELAHARPVRGFAPRLSIHTEYRPCTPVPRPVPGSVPHERCGENQDPPPTIGRIVAAGESLDPDTLRAAALAAVIWWDGLEESQHTALARLEDARRLSANPVPVLVDLSGVHLVRAGRTQNARDLVMGLNAALEALTLDPANQAALFNAALALQAFGIDEQAVEAWDGYLAADSTSAWAEEARRRRGEVLQATLRLHEPTPESDTEAVDAFAAHDPQRARMLGWDRVLGEWGTAVLEHDTARAEGLLRLAEGLGLALERRGGDASLADAVQALRDAREDEDAVRTLARAHRAYAAGQAHVQDPERLPGEDFFAVALRLRPRSPALVGWARAYRARTLIYAGNRGAAMAVLDSLRSETDAARHPALLARVQWMSGTSLLRASEFDAARERYTQAHRAFGRIGESENSGATRYLAAEVAYEQGDTLQAYAMLHQALGALRPLRGSIWLHGVLLELAEFALKDGMPWAAGRIHDEDVAVALRTGYPTAGPEALMARARLHALAGSAPRALADMDTAGALVRLLNLDHFTHTLRFSRAVLAARTGDPGHAPELDSAVSYFGRPNNENVVWLLPTLLRRADLRLLAGDTAGADADLDTVTARIRTLSRRTADVHLRAAVLHQARSRFEQRVMLHVRGGRPGAALEALERGRLSFAPEGELHRPAGGRRALPPGYVGVAYALIGDTLLAWTLRGDSVALVEGRVHRDSLRFAVERAALALEAPGRVARAEPHLRRLYEWLILPVRPALGPAETPLWILADGSLGGIPFAALRDRRGRYLVEDHPLRMVASFADRARGAPVPAPGPGSVLLVADPAFDPRVHPALDRLRGAAAEVDSLRVVYPGASVLGGEGATADAFGAAARRASLIHFAGHAVYDDARPERSFLVLAGEDRLAANAAGALDLRGVRLVVLSACRTLRSRAGRAEGSAGLSGALLSAGAGGVVGSLWQVDDELALPLMRAFHRSYAASGSPADALREAQLEMLRSPHPARRSPFAWAAFRYVGA